MDVKELAVRDAFSVHPRLFHDERGSFGEFYRHEALREAVGHPLDLRQGNSSVSRRGVVRGLHFADVPPGQAKYVTCARGAVLDVVADIRLGSPTFGQWDAVRLDDEARAAVYVPEGLAHGFVALTDDATVLYLCSAVYTPTGEHGITPADPELAVDWGTAAPILSEKDEAAPTLAEAAEQGLLPDYASCRQFYASLAAPS